MSASISQPVAQSARPNVLSSFHHILHPIGINSSGLRSTQTSLAMRFLEFVSVSWGHHVMQCDTREVKYHMAKLLSRGTALTGTRGREDRFFYCQFKLLIPFMLTVIDSNDASRERGHHVMQCKGTSHCLRSNKCKICFLGRAAHGEIDDCAICFYNCSVSS